MKRSFLRTVCIVCVLLVSSLFFVACNDNMLDLQQEVYYYDDFSACIVDVNTSSTANRVAKSSNNVCVRSTNEKQVSVIKLLQNIVASDVCYVNVPVELELAGKNYHFMNEGEYAFVFKDKAKINAQQGCEISSNGKLFYHKSSLEILGGKYSIGSGKNSEIDICFIYGESAEGNNVVLKNAAFTADVDNSKEVVGILECGDMSIDNCTFDVQNQGEGDIKVILSDNAARDFSINGCEIYTRGNKNVYGIYMAENTSDEELFRFIKDCTIETITYTSIADEATFGVYVQQGYKTVSIVNCNINADARDNSRGFPYAMAIKSYSILDVQEGTYVGTHVGIAVEKSSKFSGVKAYSCAHGGVYFGGIDEVYFIENSEIGCKEYIGEFNWGVMENQHFASFYIGGASGYDDNIVYMNNCTLTDIGQYAGVVRGSSGEKGGKLYISNTSLPKGKKLRIDKNNNVIVGVGTNITDNNVTDPTLLTLTTEQYSYENVVQRQ